MNKKVLATALLCFSLLLPALPVVSASEASAIVDPTMYPTNTTLSQGELLALLEHATVEDEGMRPIDEGPGGGAPPAKVKTMIIVDDDLKMWFECHLFRTVSWSEVFDAANKVLEDGDDPFFSWFEIDFVACEYRTWDSPQGSLWDLLTWAQQTFPKPTGIDVTFVFTGQHEWWVLGKSDGCDGFIVSIHVLDYFHPLANVWQHEASHVYGARDHSVWDLTSVCIMNYNWDEFTRSWCSGCASTITKNQYHFG